MKRTTCQRPAAFQSGFGLPTAIFVITVMALLAAGVNFLISQNAQTFAEDVQLRRAFYAAESGAGFAMNALFPPEEFPQYQDTATCPDNAQNPREYAFEVDGLKSCSAKVSCTNEATVDGVNYYTIESTGTCGDVSRRIQIGSRFAP